MSEEITIQKLVEQALAKIRIKGRKRSPSKKTRAFTIASLAGQLWELEWGICSYGASQPSLLPTVTNLSAQDKKYYLNKLSKWRDLSELEKVFLTHEYMCVNPDIVPVSFTFNVSDRAEKTILNSNTLNYPRDITAKAFKMVLGKHKVLFWMVEEKTPRVHFHGVVGVPKAIATPETFRALETALSNSPMVKKRVECGRNKKAHVSPSYETKRKQLKPVDSGAVIYATKTWTNNNQSRAVISSLLRKTTGDKHDNTLKLLKAPPTT